MDHVTYVLLNGFRDRLALISVTNKVHTQPTL